MFWDVVHNDLNEMFWKVYMFFEKNNHDSYVTDINNGFNELYTFKALCANIIYLFF